MLTWSIRHVVYPAMDLRDPQRRLRILAELERSQWLPEEQVRAIQWARLSQLVAYASRHVPYYRGRFADVGAKVADFSPGDFFKLPILTKEDVRTNFRNLVSDRFARQELRVAKTGGSTGTALTVLFDDRCDAIRNAAAMRSDRWAGWDFGVPRGAVWGNPPKIQTLRDWLRWKVYHRTVFLDTLRLDEVSVARFLSSCAKGPRPVLFGHAHSLYVLACFARQLGIRPRRPRGIISTSMTLLSLERALIEAVFRCPVTDRYGCEEVGLIACECEHHSGLHVNAENVFVEILDDQGRPVAPGEEGNVVVTDLVNYGMPLVRYLVGDTAVRTEQACPCGRGLPLIGRVGGRTADFLQRPDGSRVAGVSLIEHTLTRIPGIRQMQIVQYAPDDLMLNVVVTDGYDEASERALVGVFREHFGALARVVVRRLDRIPQTRSGKYRFSISYVGRQSPAVRETIDS